MKKKMNEIYSRLQEMELKISPGYRPILAQYHMYKSLAILINTLDDIDTEKYLESTTKMVAAYLSIPTNNLASLLSAVYTFYNSYLLFEVDDILNGFINPDSAIYDESYEARFGMILAIADSVVPNSVDVILDNILNMTKS